MIKKGIYTNCGVAFLFNIIFFLSSLTAIQSCKRDPSDIATQKITTSPAFDSLQGKWVHHTTTYKHVSTPGVIFTILGNDSCEFRSDLTGRDHFPPFYPYVTLNFTYNLLPDDSTLIFNTGSIGNPVYDTVIIQHVGGGSLVHRSKAKTIINPPYFNGTYYVYSNLMRF